LEVCSAEVRFREQIENILLNQSITGHDPEPTSCLPITRLHKNAITDFAPEFGYPSLRDLHFRGR